MKTTSLCGKWKMTGNGYDCEGVIPGSLYSFLLNAGLIEDPYYRDNESFALELTRHDYTFEKRFDFTPDGNCQILRFEGLDTFCDIELNGVFIAHTDNMHVTYEFDVTNYLVKGENVLKVTCREIHTYIKEKHKQAALYNSFFSLAGFAHIRKSHCMLGWDWGPYLPDMGIWRPVYLITKNSASITNFKIEQKHDNGRVFIKPLVEIDGVADCRVTVTCPDGKTKYNIKANAEWEVPSPELWWPRGLGKQPLYTVSAEVIENGKVCDVKQLKIGLRTLKLIRERDKWGESFTHECNGLKFFAMGADYIPEDNILSRCSKERTRELLNLCVGANFNAIRVWGGGHYPEDYFFDLCDELGIVVFFDLAFACTLYHPDEKMIESIKKEVRQNLRRLRHHPSIALVCGNNEVESANFQKKGTEPFDSSVPILVELFTKIIAEIEKEECGEIPYIHTSPLTMDSFVTPNDENYGDSHYWTVWHGGKPFTEYRNHHFRYLSEFGFQSFPSEKTLNAVTLPEDRNIFSRVMELHQRNNDANSKIINYLSQNFLYPNNFGTLIYASQLLQAEAIRYGVEHLRRERGRCMGTLYWQLNDIWPTASWSSVDYYGRLKALHYYAKRFYSPVLLSCEEIGETATRPFVIMEPYFYDYETKAKLSITNDTRNEVKGVVNAYLRNADGEILQSFSWNVSVSPFSVLTLDETNFNKTNVLENYYSFELIVEDKVISEGSVLFTAPKHFKFKDPKLSAEIVGDEIIIRSKAFAKSVEIDSPDCDMILSDNYFDINFGEKRVKILKGNPKTLSLRSVYNIR
ncbi:MAG: glycoside hydrolase family 2 protein [Clostridia bacterium]|nr:glycoside hydrolase family 2 protein [Clostridia bacterium]